MLNMGNCSYDNFYSFPSPQDDDVSREGERKTCQAAP
jgi:hypothetical protein